MATLSEGGDFVVDEDEEAGASSVDDDADLSTVTLLLVLVFVLGDFLLTLACARKEADVDGWGDWNA